MIKTDILILQNTVSSGSKPVRNVKYMKEEKQKNTKALITNKNDS